MISRAAVALLAVLVATPGLAFNFECSRFQTFGQSLERPRQPTCVDAIYPPFDKDFALDFRYEVESCRSEIDTYRAKLNDYLSCLKSEGDDVVSGYNDLVRRFNCKARGSYC